MVDEVLGMSKVTTKYQVTIPVDARRRFKIKEGDRLIFKDSEGRLYIERAA
jgi:AbrB family looped-hinge helix DNA binding protein